MWAHRDKVAVAGVGYSQIGRRLDRSLAGLALDACRAAVEDAGATMSDIDGIATSPAMPRYGGRKGVEEGIDVVTPWAFAAQLGVAGNLAWTGSTNAMVTQSVIDGTLAIAAGLCTHVLVYRALHVPDGRYINFDNAFAAGADQHLAPYGFSMPPAWAAIVFQRYLALYGYTRADMAPYIVANRANADRNPNAYWRGKPLTADDYLTARMIAEPMSLLDCDLPVDGACALLLTTAERARDLRHMPALISGFAASTHNGAPGTPMNLDDVMEGSRQTMRRLWAMSGLAPADIDNAQLYDGFSPLVITWAEAAGLAKPGEGLAFVRDGRLPINTGGGALGEGRLHGMTQLAESALQVSGRAGARQVPDATHALATISNGLSKATAFAISRGG